MKKLKVSHYNVLIPVPEEQEFIVYNTFSGGLTIVEWEDGQLLQKLDQQPGFTFEDYPAQGELLDSLLEEGYLVPDEMDEQDQYVKFVNNMAHQRTYESSSISLTIGTTIICNMGCPYCFEFDKPNKSLKDDDVIEAIMDYLEGMVARAPVKKWDSVSITWYGGEPLVNKVGIERLSPLLIEFGKKTQYSGILCRNYYQRFAVGCRNLAAVEEKPDIRCSGDHRRGQRSTQ